MQSKPKEKNSDLQFEKKRKKIITNKKNVGKTSEPAVTDYKVLATSGNASFVQTEMVTGRKHQIRLHLGLGLGSNG